MGVITASRERWIDTMMAEEYGQPKVLRAPWKAALSTFAAFIICGAVPLLPFAVSTGRKPNPELAAIEGNKVVYKKTLAGEDVVSFPITGFGETASDHEIRVENRALKAGVSMRGDKPLKSVSLWSIRSNISVEPFVAVSVAPGNEFRWTSSYRYYSIP